MTNRTTVDHPIGAIALLEEPNRQRLYDLVTDRREPVGREMQPWRSESAGSLPPSTSIDLPKAGCSRLSIAVVAPEAGQAPVAPPSSIDGAAARGKARVRPGRPLLTAHLDVLRGAGYEPRVEKAAHLGNCPYDAPAAEHRDLTCGTNLAWAKRGHGRTGLAHERPTRRSPATAAPSFRQFPAGPGRNGREFRTIRQESEVEMPTNGVEERAVPSVTNPLMSGTGLTELPTALRLQILTTEHWSLLSTRAMSWNETSSRTAAFLAALSGAVVALALVAQATAFGEGFVTFAVLILPVVLFLGVATFVRLVQINHEDVRWVIGMNLLRHAYLEAAPELRPYFITGWHDDEAGIMATFGARVGPGGFVHEFVTAPGMLAVVDAVLAGVLAAILGPRLGAASSITIGLAITAGLLTIALLAAYQYRGAVRPRAQRRPRFPEGAIVSDAHHDPKPVR